MKKNITCLLIVIFIIGLFYSMTDSQTNTSYLHPLPKPKEKPIESLPSIIKRIEPSTVTAPISPGSSGSPVLNMKGEIIGIATFQFIERQNLNFAIPSERIASLNLAREKKTTVGEELFEQEEKGKKDSEYNYEAYDKALYFIKKREYEIALPYLEIAIKTDISSLKSRVYFQIGYCYLKLKSYPKAIEAYTVEALGKAISSLTNYFPKKEGFFKFCRI